MRLLLSATIGVLLCAAPALAQDNSGGAMGQLENATSGNQTLEQTYGDQGHDEQCPEACPDGGDINVPEPPPPTPVDDNG